MSKFACVVQRKLDTIWLRCDALRHDAYFPIRGGWWVGTTSTTPQHVLCAYMLPVLCAYFLSMLCVYFLSVLCVYFKSVFRVYF